MVGSQKMDHSSKNEFKFVDFCMRALQNKKAQHIQTFDFRKWNHFPCLYAVIASGQNTRHTKIMADFLIQSVKKSFFKTYQMEGRQTGHWVVIDYGNVMVHIFYHYIREHYQLENIWKKASLLTGS